MAASAYKGVKKTLTFDPSYNVIGSQFIFGFVRIQYGILVDCSRNFDVVAFALMTGWRGNSCCWEGRLNLGAY